MGADNYGICPACKVELENQRRTDEKKLKASYGVLPEDEYREMHARVTSPSTWNPSQSLREDYDIGIDKDGEFRVSYRGKCDVCDFEFRYGHTEMSVTY